MNEEKSIEILNEFKNFKNFFGDLTITFKAKESMDIAIETLLTSYEKQKDKIKKIQQIVDIYDNTSGEFATLPNGEEICISDNAPVLEYLQELFKEEN